LLDVRVSRLQPSRLFQEVPCISHLEVVGALARLHLKPMKFNREDAEADPLIAIAGGGGINLYNSMGNAWTAD